MTQFYVVGISNMKGLTEYMPNDAIRTLRKEVKVTDKLNAKLFLTEQAANRQGKDHFNFLLERNKGLELVVEPI